jgi:hypothetical protein
MDVVVIYYPTKWSMLLSKKWTSNARGDIQMDYDIHVTPMYKVILFYEIVEYEALLLDLD